MPRYLFQSVQASWLRLSLCSKEETFPAGCEPWGLCPGEDRPLFFFFFKFLVATRAGIRFDFFFFAQSVQPLPRSTRTRARVSGCAHTQARKRVAAARSATLWGARGGAPLPTVVVGAGPASRCVVKRAGVSDWSSLPDNTCSTPSFK